MDKKIRSYVPVFFLLLGGILMLYRAQYGVDFTDESYYLAEAGRFYQGDRPLREEWFPTQLIGVVLLPFYAGYVEVTGGGEGILLFFRILYTICAMCVAVLAYVQLRKEGLDGIPALIFSLSILFYARANIPTLSYYNIGTLSFLTYLLVKDRMSIRWQIIGGAAFAVSVLCMPYLVLYFAFLVILYIIQAIRKDECTAGSLGQLLGVAVCALAFLIYFCGSGDVESVFRNLPEILKDPEHQGSMLGSLIDFVDFMVRVFYRFLFFPMILEFTGIIYYRRTKKKNRTKMLLKTGAYALFFLQSVYLRTFFEGGILIAFFLLAVQISLLDDCCERRIWKRYALPGLAYGIIWMFGSNVGQRVFNMGCLIADIWALQIIWTDVKSEKRRWIQFIKQGSMILVVAVLLLIRCKDIYRDSSLEMLTERLDRGAAKGIYTTKERAAEYKKVLQGLEKYAGSDRTLVVQGTNPWIYLESDAKCGAYAAWKVDFEDSRNEIYYERYPEKIPDVIFLLSPSYGSYESWRYSSHGSNRDGMGSKELERYLKKLVEDHGYHRSEEDCGVFYVKSS